MSRGSSEYFHTMPKVLTKKSTYKKDVVQDEKPGIKRTYTSRRSIIYDDEKSGGEDPTPSNYNDTGAITYKDTKGKVSTLMPNMRLIKYRHIF